ncbi:MAG: transmembrane 220 family protein [Kiloniellales bacterium]
MRYLNGFFCLLLILFAAVQYNDPDAVLWFLIYAVPAAWAGVAAFRPQLLQGIMPTAGLGACLVASVAGMLYMWPTEAGWWRIDVWWEIEVVREAMGLMVITIVLAVVALTRWLAPSGPREKS